jgi:hypothetical protein
MGVDQEGVVGLAVVGFDAPKNEVRRRSRSSDALRRTAL